MKRTIIALVAALALAAVAASASHTATLAWSTTVVATGLDSPRGVAIAPGGTLYVAEAGLGGDICDARQNCIGTTSKISKVDTSTGTVTPVVTGLWSSGGP